MYDVLGKSFYLEASYQCDTLLFDTSEYWSGLRKKPTVYFNKIIIPFSLSIQISNQKKKTGVIAPKRFIQRLKKQNEIFRSYMHQVIHFASDVFQCVFCSFSKLMVTLQCAHHLLSNFAGPLRQAVKPRCSLCMNHYCNFFSRCVFK